MPSELYRKIYDLTTEIPYGQVTTYGQLARLVGNPRLSRIVGCAMHVAPDGLPCHRVLNQRGELCEAFAPLGKDTHRLLLEMEGVTFLPDGRVDMDRHMWYGRSETE